MNRTIIAYKTDDLDISEDPVKFMAFWKDQFESIPKEFVDSARITIEAITKWECEYLEVKITYERPETTEEKRDRNKQARQSAGRNKARDLETLAKLQAKYPTVK